MSLRKMHQFRTNRLPSSFENMFTPMRDTEDRNNRDSYFNYAVSVPVKKSLLNFPRVIFIPIWNALPSKLQCIESHKVFKKESKNNILDGYSEIVDCENPNCDDCLNAM